MKRAVNIRLEESIIILLNQLSQEFETTKTDIIEKALKMFSKEKTEHKNDLLQFAGKLNSIEANKMLVSIQDDKNSKEFSL